MIPGAGMSVAAPVLVSVAGLLLWSLASNPRASEAGRILFFCGALVAVAGLSGTQLSIGR